jgi:hypothetical protein
MPVGLNSECQSASTVNGRVMLVFCSWGCRFPLSSWKSVYFLDFVSVLITLPTQRYTFMSNSSETARQSDVSQLRIGCMTAIIRGFLAFIAARRTITIAKFMKLSLRHQDLTEVDVRSPLSTLISSNIKGTSLSMSCPSSFTFLPHVGCGHILYLHICQPLII